jgi:hypothetical protein
MKRLTTVVAGAVLAASIGVAAAEGQAPQGRTLVLTELAQGGREAFVDNPPRAKRTREGEPRRVSVGDIFALSGRIADQQRNRVGTLHEQCVVTVPGTPRNAQAICTAVLALKDGQISAVFALVGERNPTASVTGGTGAYAGARGTVTSVSNPDGSSTDTFQLLP